MTRLLTGFLLITLIFCSFAGNGKSVEYMIDGKKYEGFFIASGSKAPFILLIHDWDGLTGYEKKRAGMLAEKGYTVFAADMFGKSIRPEKTEDKKKLTGELYGNRQKMRLLLGKALEKARDLGASVDNGVAVGYCFGGTCVLELARSGERMKGFAVFHGGLLTPDDQNYKTVKGRLLILHGAADKAAPVDDFIDCAKKLESDGADHEMILYGGADHAFSVFGGARYNKAADEKSWQRFLMFLGETTGSGRKK